MTKPDLYDRAQTKVTRLAVELNEVDQLSLDQVANALMSGAIALAVGVSGKEATVAHLGAIAAAVASGRYDDAAEIETNPLN
jgi:hypothetical protein